MTFRRLLARVAATFLLLPALTHCGGGAGTGTIGPPPTPLPTGANVTPIIVDAGAKAQLVNIPSVSVTICAPGTSNCQTIDHILLDTQSTGLRIIASVLSPSVVLPQVHSAAGDSLFNCLVFANQDYIWGGVNTADVQIANGQASSLAVQLISDHAVNPSVPVTPTDCSQSNLTVPRASLATVTALGSNGILGISVFRQDCGTLCLTSATAGYYYGCPASGCVGATVSRLADELNNPISQMTGNDRNGVLIVLPAIEPSGRRTATGALVLGVDTEANNQLGTATVLGLDPATGNFTTTYKGQRLTASFMDTGSNGLFFPDSSGSLPVCAASSGFYCPASAQALTASNQGVGANNTPTTISFSIVNEESVTTVNGNFAAFDNIGGPSAGPNTFDWGLPFFFGRKVFMTFEGQTSSAGAGPFVAY